MITIITGTPGTGKTAYVVSELEKITGRNIYVDGIPDLMLPHEPAPLVSEWVSVDHDESGATSHRWNIPANSIVVVDEAQRSFRPRPAGSKVPDYVAALETHRHAGLDFWFITQHPGLIDVNIRRLCGRHIHVRNTPLGRRLHESTQVFDPENKSERESTVTRPYKLPAQVFGKYKSAEVHTKSSKRLPLSFYVVLVAVAGFIGVAYMGYQSITEKMQPSATAQAPEASMAQSPPLGGIVTPSDPSAMLVEFSPAVPGRPETAPAFDALRVVKSMPVVVGCIDTGTRCRCQNQQGTDAGLDNMQCRQWMASPPFDPYREPLAVQALLKPEKEGQPRKDEDPQAIIGPADTPDTPPTSRRL